MSNINLKGMKKRKHLVFEIILLLVVLVLFTLCVSVYSTNKKQQGQIVRENQSKWTGIYEMTQKVEMHFVNSEDWTQVEDLRLYVNGIVYYDGIQTIEPQFRLNFLTLYYDTFFRTLCVEDERIKGYEEEGFQLFSNMNKELKQISKSVLDKIDRGENFLDPKSEEYKETSKELQEFCKKYENAVDEFYEKVNNGSI